MDADSGPRPSAIDAAIDRFRSLASRNRRARIAANEAAPQPTPDQVRAGQLESWLRDPAADVFIAWLDSLIAVSRGNAHASLKDHPEVCRWLGAGEAYSLLLDELLRIRGTSA